MQWKHLHDLAMSSSDYPGLADKGTTAEMEAIAVLGSGQSGRGTQAMPRCEAPGILPHL